MSFDLRRFRVRRAVTEIVYALLVIVSYFISKDLFTFLSLLYFVMVLVSALWRAI